MRKIETLRAAIFAALPELDNAPDRLRVWIERGTAQSTQTADHSLAFAFQLNVVVVEMSTDITLLFLAIFKWLRVNQPELMEPGKDAIGFDAEILDNGAADVLLQLQLDQAVSALPRPDGSIGLNYEGEPDVPDLEILGILDPEAAAALTGVTIEEDILPPWEL